MSFKYVIGLTTLLSICCLDTFALQTSADVVKPVVEISLEATVNPTEVGTKTSVANALLSTREKFHEIQEQIETYVTIKQAEEYEKNLHETAVNNVSPNARSSAKTFMYYTSITNRKTKQYRLQNSEECYTDPETGIRMVGNRYCIALGTGYCKKIGTRIDLVLENGEIIQCILGEVKSDRHTDEATHTYHVGGYDDDGIYREGDGSVAEFIVDKGVFLEVRKEKSGNVNWVDGFDGRISKVIVIPDDAVLVEDVYEENNVF